MVDIPWHENTHSMYILPTIHLYKYCQFEQRLAVGVSTWWTFRGKRTHSIYVANYTSIYILPVRGGPVAREHILCTYCQLYVYIYIASSSSVCQLGGHSVAREHILYEHILYMLPTIHLYIYIQFEHLVLPPPSIRCKATFGERTHSIVREHIL